MISSLVAIILVQVYWTYSAWMDKEEEFSLSVIQSLKTVSSQIQDRELADYIAAFERSELPLTLRLKNSFILFFQNNFSEYISS